MSKHARTHTHAYRRPWYASLALRSIALVAVLAALSASSCTQKDLALTNIANLNAVPIQTVPCTPAVGDTCPGQLVVKSDLHSLDSVKAAMEAFDPSVQITINPPPIPTQFIQITSAKHLALVPGLTKGGLPDFQTAFFPLVGLDFSSLTGLAPTDKIVLNIGLDTNPLNPIALESRGTSLNDPKLVVDKTLGVQLGPIENPAFGFPEDFRIGLWIPMRITPEAPLYKTFHFGCDCSSSLLDPDLGHVDGSPYKALPLNACHKACEALKGGAFDGEALVGDLAIQINSIPLDVGFAPGAALGVNAKESPPSGVFGRAMHKTYGLDLVAASVPTYGIVVQGGGQSSDDALNAVKNDTTHDIVVGVGALDSIGGQNEDLFNTLCAGGNDGARAGCSQVFAEVIAGNVSREVLSELNTQFGTLQTKLLPDNLAQPPQVCTLQNVDGCDLKADGSPTAPGCCSAADMEALLGASLQFAIYDLFYSPFGDFPNGSYLPVTDIQETYLFPTENCGRANCPEACDGFVTCGPLDENGNVDCSASNIPDASECAAEGGKAPGVCQHMGCLGADQQGVQLTFSYLADTDGDGIPSNVDTCWWIHDPDGSTQHDDTDGDGIPDACDPCPCDPLDDIDHDGVCDNILSSPKCLGLVPDNCPLVYNPDQANANHTAELARQAGDPSVAILGNQCDPVPVPDFSVRGAAMSNSHPPGVVFNPATQPGFPPGTAVCGTFADNVFDMRFIASHADDPTLKTVHEVAPTRVTAPTGARFCQIDQAVGRLCKDLTVFVHDTLFIDTDCAAGCINHETSATLFHRVSFSQGGNTNRDGAMATPNYAYDEPTNPVRHNWVWNDVSDADFWIANGFITVSSAPAVDPGTALAGTMWFHAVTDVGAASHGQGLANHYEFGHNTGTFADGIAGYTPRYNFCYACLEVHQYGIPKSGSGSGGGAGGGSGASGTPSQGASAAPFLIWRPESWLGDRNFVRVDAARDEASLVVPLVSTNTAVAGPLQYAAMGGGACQGQDVTDRLGAALSGHLADTTLTWANAVEPMRAMGAANKFPMAIALSPTGKNLEEVVFNSGDQLLGIDDIQQPAETFPGPREGSPHTLGYTPVLTSARHGIFVIGGIDPVTGPSGEIWFSPIESDHWSRLPTAFVPNNVLAATFSFASDELIILDETPDPTTSSCRSAVLDTANASTSTAIFDPPASFAIPATVTVTSGSALSATLDIVDAGSKHPRTIHCQYVPSALPSTLVLKSCNHHMALGSVVLASSTTLSAQAAPPSDDGDDGDDDGDDDHDHEHQGWGRDHGWGHGDPTGHGPGCGSHGGGSGTSSAPLDVTVTLSEVAPCDGASGVARLVAIDFMTGHSNVLGTWPRHAEWDRHSLAVDMDGSVIIASSNTDDGIHALARLDVRNDHALTVLNHEKGALALPVVVDATGYTLIAFAEPFDGSLTHARVERLKVTPSSASQTLGDQL